jgi:hypothetical protein
LQELLANFWNPQTFAKLVFLAVTAPFWWPLAKVMYREILPALNAVDEAQTVRRAPGQDPFLNIPLASYRARQARAVSRGPRAGQRRI